MERERAVPLAFIIDDAAKLKVRQFHFQNRERGVGPCTSLGQSAEAGESEDRAASPVSETACKIVDTRWICRFAGRAQQIGDSRQLFDSIRMKCHDLLLSTPGRARNLMPKLGRRPFECETEHSRRYSHGIGLAGHLIKIVERFRRWWRSLSVAVLPLLPIRSAQSIRRALDDRGRLRRYAAFHVLVPRWPSRWLPIALGRRLYKIPISSPFRPSLKPYGADAIPSRHESCGISSRFGHALRRARAAALKMPVAPLRSIQCWTSSCWPSDWASSRCRWAMSTPATGSEGERS